MQPAKQKNNASNIVGVVVALVFGAVAVWAILERQMITDRVLASQYTPSAEMKTIKDQLQLTGKGKFLFDASQPKIQPASDFNKSCGRRIETNNPILGCYYLQRIYVFDVPAKELEGIEQTTAAHELLHAAYERLSDDDRTEINAEIRKVMRTIETPELQERMRYYQRTEPGQEFNELFAILGSEFPSVGAALERKYAEYFTSREKVVAFYDKYNTVFTDVKARLNSQKDAINSLTRQTNNAIAAYERNVKQLDQDIKEFNDQANNGDFSNSNEFNAKRSSLAARQQQINQERTRLQQQIASIKQLTQNRNKLVEKYNALNESIDSNVEPAPIL